MNSTPYPPTPELDKMKAVRNQSQCIGAFLDWLFNEKRQMICEISPDGVDWLPTDNQDIQKILAEYFGIDLQKVEAERRAILERLQS